MEGIVLQKLDAKTVARICGILARSRISLKSRAERAPWLRSGCGKQYFIRDLCCLNRRFHVMHANHVSAVKD